MRGRIVIVVAAAAALVLIATVIIRSVTVPSPPQGRPARATASSGSAPAAPSTTAAPPTTSPPAPVWRVAWGSAMAWGYGEIDDATVRNLVSVSVGGSAIRFRISNVFGNVPLHVGAATVARAAAGSAVQPGTMHALTFGGAPSVTVPAGAVVYTDAAEVPVTAGEVLAVSLWIQGPDLVSLHPCCGNTPHDWFTPNGRGDVTTALSLAGVSIASPFERFVDAMDVLQTGGEGSIVVLGDSITDGFNASLRWTDVLQSRVDQLPPDQRRAIVNEGITANALTSYVHTDDLTGGGPSGVSRLQRDVLDQPGVSEVIVLLGTNDLWFGATAQEVIAGYREVIAQAHAAGVRIVGMTLLPRQTSPTEYWSPLDQQELQTVNQWITTSGAFDQVIHSARAVADIYNGQCDPTAMFPPFDSGDHLHPDAAGQTALANAVAPEVLGVPSLPPARPLLAVTPTPGCSPVAA